MYRLEIEGKDYALTLGFEELDRLEKALSTTVLILAKKVADEVVSLQELMAIIHYAIEPAARGMDLKKAVFEAGMTQVMQMVTGMFVEVFEGRKTTAADSSGRGL